VVRERRRRGSLRTIHLSQPADVRARLAALRDGFDEALPQAIDPDELAARAVILEERARVRAATCLQIADGYELDLVAHELRHDAHAVHLRPKEFQLLAMLAAHPGRAYTRRQLLDRVWGPDQVGDPRTVDVHIRWLRSKIEAQPDRPIHLVTVRGVGYRLDPPLTEP
jgi:DNA-binding response OmpR family regulator